MQHIPGTSTQDVNPQLIVFAICSGYRIYHFASTWHALFAVA